MTIEIPVHPDDIALPRSFVQLQMPSGKTFSFANIPIQGVKTLQNALDILEIWRPTIVEPDPPERQITLYNVGLAMWQTGAWKNFRNG